MRLALFRIHQLVLIRIWYFSRQSRVHPCFKVGPRSRSHLSERLDGLFLHQNKCAQMVPEEMLQQCPIWLGHSQWLWNEGFQGLLAWPESRFIPHIYTDILHVLEWANADYHHFRYLTCTQEPAWNSFFLWYLLYVPLQFRTICNNFDPTFSRRYMALQ